jgi:hypothetical protein
MIYITSHQEMQGGVKQNIIAHFHYLKWMEYVCYQLSDNCPIQTSEDIKIIVILKKFTLIKKSLC